MTNLTPPLLAIAAALASALPARAEPSAQGDPLTQETAEQESADQELADLAALRKRLAAWKLRVATDANGSEAWTELTDLRTAAEKAALASPKDEMLRSLLSDLDARAILWTARQGDVEATSERIVALRLAANERSTFPRKTILLAAAMTLGREDVRDVAASLPEGAERAALPRPVGQNDDVVIARAVREAVSRGDSEFITKIGKRAVPALTDLALVMDGSPIPEGEDDPLRRLIRIDHDAGIDVALELLRRDEYLLLQEVQETLVKVLAFYKDDAWVPIGETDWELVNPAWEEILVRLIEGAEGPSANLANMIQRFARRGAIPRALGPECRRALEAPRFVTSAPDVFPEAGRWFYVDLLESTNARVRDLALGSLFSAPHANEILRSASSPDVGVRVGVAEAMSKRLVKRWSDPSRRTVIKSDEPLIVDDAYVETMKALLTDSSLKVQDAAASSALKRSGERGSCVLDGPAVRSLLPRVDISTLSMLGYLIPFLPEAERFPTLAEYVTAVGAKEVDEDAWNRAIGNTLRLDDYGLSFARDLWPLAAVIEREVGLKDWLLLAIVNKGVMAVEALDASTSELIDWLEAHATVEIWQQTLGQATITHRSDAWLTRATSAERARMLRLVADMEIVPTNPSNRATIWNIQYYRYEIEPVDLVALVRDSSAPLNARHWAARSLARVAPRELELDMAGALTEILAATDYRFGPEEFSRNPGAPELADAILQALLTDPTVADEKLLRFDMRLDDPVSLELAITRFPPETWATHQSSKLMIQVVEALVRASTENVDPRLAAANIPGSKLQERLAYTIGSLRSEALFPLLAEVMRTAPPYDDEWRASLQAVTGYLNDDAAALLIETARRTTNEEGRKLVLASLDQIVAWQDAAARWERGRNAAERRADAIDDLVALAGDAQQPAAVRSEALRGLGLLDAAEELPLLVRALTSEDELLRAAAREAIDRLHAGRSTDDK